MQLSEILSELENNTGKFPHVAVERAIHEKEAITPVLLATLEESKNHLEELLDKSDYILHIYALYLLAQFREPLAHPLIVEFFSTPGDISLDVTRGLVPEDFLIEDLGRIFASTSGGNIDLIKQLIENQITNGFVRCAALHSLVVLVAQGIISREQVIQYFEELFSTLKDNKSEYIWTNLVIYSSQLYPIELKEHIDRLFEEDAIDALSIDPEEVEDYLQLGIEAALNQLRDDPHYSLIEDTISEMEDWDCFQGEISQKVTPSPFPKQGFSHSNKSKEQAKNKKKMQKESRRKNRQKKK
jgi:hypothetical protein